MLITDPADPRLDDIRNLNKSDKSGEGLVIAEGPLVVSRLAESRFPMRCLVGFPKKVEAYISEYGEPECPIYEVSRETLAEVAGFDPSPHARHSTPLRIIGLHLNGHKAFAA